MENTPFAYTNLHPSNPSLVSFQCLSLGGCCYLFLIYCYYLSLALGCELSLLFPADAHAPSGRIKIKNENGQRQQSLIFEIKKKLLESEIQ